VAKLGKGYPKWVCGKQITAWWRPVDSGKEKFKTADMLFVKRRQTRKQWLFDRPGDASLSRLPSRRPAA
jgi:hypothetical protein